MSATLESDKIVVQQESCYQESHECCHKNSSGETGKYLLQYVTYGRKKKGSAFLFFSRYSEIFSSPEQEIVIIGVFEKPFFNKVNGAVFGNGSERE